MESKKKIRKPRKTTIGLCFSLKKDLEVKKKKEIWKQVDEKKKIEKGWICIEEIMMLVDNNCL